MTEKEYMAEVSIEHRKKFAQFFTPEEVADFMVSWVLKIETKQPIRILEPAFGLGIFSRKIRERGKDVSTVAYEIDDKIIESGKGLHKNDRHLSLFSEDYMEGGWYDRYDGIVCNPPYFKFHDYDNTRLVGMVNKHLNIRLTKFTNLYTLFLVKSLYQLKPGGRLAYIVPSEFLNSDYGVEVKRYMLTNHLLRHVIVVDFKKCVFGDALTTACILFCEKSSFNGEIKFSNIEDIDSLDFALVNFVSYKAEDVDCSVKWRRYYDFETQSKEVETVDFSTFAKVSRGIATGANEYFTLNKGRIEEFHIPEAALVKCISHSADVKGIFFSEEKFEKLTKENKKVFLFRGEGYEKDTHVAAYLKKGYEEKINTRYLTSQRTPWYALENRAAAPIWVNVFNRSGLRFIRNEAMIRNLTTFHCIYPKNTVDTNILFSYLVTDFAKEILMRNARQYGNGLVKFEPNDVNKGEIVDLRKLTVQEEELILSCYPLLASEDKIVKKTVDLLDDIFRTIYTSGLSEEKIVSFKKTLKEIEKEMGMNNIPITVVEKPNKRIIRQLSLF